ncbi:MAG: LCP family protein [Enterocloster clostridioformis]|uniref:LCP family protein n=1 Tax=Enterocloster clostridioformis TaxID=1531 RepID=UPI0028FF8FFE|nr:LCP family protein [Enterocloster clostridioformis]MDU1960951.1 LCP family protein [Enterocloster clostridioformis]
MNNRENDDELERMRARARRGGVRQGGGAYQRPAQSVRERRSTRQSYDGRDEYDEEYYYGEEYGVEGDRQVDFSMEDYLDDEPPVPSRRLRSSHGSSGSARGRQAQSSGSRQARNQRRAGNRRQDTMERGRASAGWQQGQMTKRRKKGRWKGLLLLLLAVFIGYGAWMFLHRPTGYWNIAVFGVDSRDGNTKNALADVQMICSIDRSTGEIRLVSVYRDTYLKINSEGSYHKINEAYFKGGHKQAVSALEENLDIKIDDYATFNWKSVAEAINILGGIDLEITPAEFKYINGFITETVNSTGIGSYQLEQAGMNHLDGVQAVAYSRLRLMDTDFQRTERQRKVVELALAKAKQADVSTLTSLAGYMVQEISTSVGVGDVLPLAKDIGKYHIGETAGFPFSRQTKKIGKMDCVVPTTLESNVVLLHQFLYGEETSYSPSSSVRKISAHISEETGLYEEGKVAPSGGGSSGGGSSGGKTPAQNVPAETPPPETAAPEETTPESTEETEETTQESTVETEETEEVGPGVSDKPTKAPESTKNPDEEQGPGAGGPGGSGAGEPSASHPTKAPETEKPDSGSGSGSDSTSQGPGSQGNGPGQAQSDADEGGPGM